MSLLPIPHTHPEVMLFDWHATLADTRDAMYHAIDDAIPKLVELDLIKRLVDIEDSRNLEDAKLVKYVREHAKLHPRVKSDRKISRTDIFEVLFGDDQEAKAIAHREFDSAYRAYVGEVLPFEPAARPTLERLRKLGLPIGILSNRKREYMEHELALIDGDGWNHLVDTLVCGDDVERRKPAPDLILKALENLGTSPSHATWYVGDSTTDIYAAKDAGVTAIFYNGAQWDRHWIDKVFPGTTRHPHRPDAVVENFTELTELAEQLLLAGEPEALLPPTE